MTIEPLCIGFTKEDFSAYVEDVVSHKMGAWRPRGITLHNTAMPNLKMVNGYLSSGKWTFEQLIRNWWVRYQKLGWRSGPHCFIHDKIWVATPLWVRGTHSPSFNATHLGLEIVGDYSTETLPDNIRDNTVHAAACVFGMLGREPDGQTLKYHNEDPRTSHKGCPGKNIGPKADWDKAIEAKMAELFPGGDYTKD